MASVKPRELCRRPLPQGAGRRLAHRRGYGAAAERAFVPPRWIVSDKIMNSAAPSRLLPAEATRVGSGALVPRTQQGSELRCPPRAGERGGRLRGGGNLLPDHSRVF